MVNITFKAPDPSAYTNLNPEVIERYQNSAPARRQRGVSYHAEDPDYLPPKLHRVPVPAMTARTSVPYQHYSPHPGYSPNYSPHHMVPRSAAYMSPAPIPHPRQHQPISAPIHAPVPVTPVHPGYFGPQEVPAYPHSAAPNTPRTVASPVQGQSAPKPIQIKSVIGNPSEALSAPSRRSTHSSAKSAKPLQRPQSKRAATTSSLRRGSMMSQEDKELYESPAVGKLISVLQESVALKRAAMEKERRAAARQSAPSIMSTSTAASTRTSRSHASATSKSSRASEVPSSQMTRAEYEAEFLRQVKARVIVRNQKVKHAAQLGEKGIKMVPPKDAPPSTEDKSWQGYITSWWTPAKKEEPAPEPPTETESLASQYYHDLFQMMRDKDVPASVGDVIVRGYEEAVQIEKDIKAETIRLRKEKEEADKKEKEKPKDKSPEFLTVLLYALEDEREFGYKIPVESIRNFEAFKKLMVLTFPSKAKHWQKECFQVFDETNNYFIMGQFWDKLIKKDTILAITLTPLPVEKEKEPKKDKAAAPATPKKKKEPSKFTKSIMVDFDKKKFNQGTSKIFKKFVEASTRPL